MVDAEKIKAEGVKLLEEFSRELKDVPNTEETHGKPERCEGFRERLRKLAPRFEDGYVIAEKND